MNGCIFPNVFLHPFVCASDPRSRPGMRAPVWTALSPLAEAEWHWGLTIFDTLSPKSL